MLHQLLTRLRATTMVGLDLGSALIKAVEVAQDEGRVLLRRCAFATVQEDDVAGALQRLVETSGLAGSHVVVAVASPEVVVRPFHFPSMPRAELEQALALEAEQAMLNGHAIHEMAVDWHLLPPAEQSPLNGLLAVVPKPVLNARLALARSARLAPTVVDVEGLALWNAYWALVGRRAQAARTVLLLNIGARTTNLVIAKEPDQLMLARDFPLGTLALGKGQERDWQSEVTDSLSYARSAGGLRTLDVAYVTGGGSGPDTARLLGAMVSAPIQIWNPLDYLVRDDESAAVETSAGPLLSIAVGLALRRLP